MTNYTKRIKGLCFVEDVFDDKNNKKSILLFDNNCALILLANKYIKYYKESQSGSYCTINRVARDLCYFYDFMLISGIYGLNIDFENLKDFVGYLKILKVRRLNESDIDFTKNKFSIERTFWETVQVLNESKVKNSNIIQLRETCGLSVESIYRIFNRAIIYLKVLYKDNHFNNDNIIRFFQKESDIRNYLKAKGIEIRKHEITPVDEDMIFVEDEMCAIKEQCTTPYERFLYYVLEKTGIRIGEALGLKIIKYDRKDLRAINCFWQPKNHALRNLIFPAPDSHYWVFMVECVKR